MITLAEKDIDRLISKNNNSNNNNDNSNNNYDNKMNKS